MRLKELLKITKERSQVRILDKNYNMLEFYDYYNNYHKSNYENYEVLKINSHCSVTEYVVNK